MMLRYQIFFQAKIFPNQYFDLRFLLLFSIDFSIDFLSFIFKEFCLILDLQ